MPAEAEIEKEEACAGPEWSYSASAGEGAPSRQHAAPMGLLAALVADLQALGTEAGKRKLTVLKEVRPAAEASPSPSDREAGRRPRPRQGQGDGGGDKARLQRNAGYAPLDCAER